MLSPLPLSQRSGLLRKLPSLLFLVELLVEIVLLLLGLIHDAKYEVDDDSQQQDDGEESRPKPVIKTSLSPDPDAFSSPVVRG